jgi:endonuclease/exonuclease/phosphatase family metal-dependent hydrolase
MKMVRIVILLFAVILFGSCRTCCDGVPTTAKTIRIASFNLQVFGQTKAGKPEVVNVMARIIRGFDVIAVQEIRDSAGTAIDTLAAAVDSTGVDYEYVIGPREGRTSSKEQYAIFYNKATIEALPGAYTYNEGGVDTFEREPYIAIFRARTGGADFVLVDIHTKPEDATAEIQFLPTVIANAAATLGDADVICLGDFNADGSYYNENNYTATFPSSTYNWLISNAEDTTVAASSNTYDRIVTTKSMTEDFAGRSGVFRFDSEFGLDAIATAAVSDHYPVWAEFAVDKDTD